MTQLGQLAGYTRGEWVKRVDPAIISLFLPFGVILLPKFTTLNSMLALLYDGLPDVSSKKKQS